MTFNGLRLRNICKSYGGVCALSNIDFDLESSGIHGLVGKNGAGKSTFVDILYGWITADTGSYEIAETGTYREIDIKKHTPVTAREKGIFLVPQEPPFALELTIEQNFFMAKPRMKSFFSFDTEAMKTQIQITLDRFRLDYSPDSYVSDVSMEDRHLLYTALITDIYDSKVILLDEVTSALPRTKTRILFDYLNEIRSKKSIVLITHRVQEICEVCDYVTVFRDGQKIITQQADVLDEHELAHLIVGKKVEIPSFSSEFYITMDSKPKENIRVNNLTSEGFYENISFTNFKGEILGITGLLESGASQVLRTICGVGHNNKGKIFFEEKEFVPETPTICVLNGIIYGTNDRIHEGIFTDMSILDNLNSIFWDKLTGKWVLNERAQKNNYDHYKGIFNIKADSPSDNVLSLSGGNQQKVMLARITLPNPKILVLDEPTKGIDVGAKYEILRILREKLIGIDKDRSIIINSSSIGELMIVCDRIIVLFAGKVSRIFNRDSFDEQAIFKAIQGVSGE